MDATEVGKAQSFWSQVDVDKVFDELLEYLMHLRESIKESTATEREYVQGMNIILESEVSLSVALRNDSIEEVLIGEDIVAVSVSDSHCPLLNLREDSDSEMKPDDLSPEENSRSFKSQDSSVQCFLRTREDCLSPAKEDPVLELPAPPSNLTLSYEPHDCSPSCLTKLPPHADYFLGHNPLRVPMLCHFQRHCAKPSPASWEESVHLGEGPEGQVGAEVTYTTPCGCELCSMGEVMEFLRETGALGVLQPENFTFDPLVQPDRQAPLRLPCPGPSGPTGPPPSAVSSSSAGAVLFERDVSRGAEAVAVPLCNEVDGVRPHEFRYRKERWPHGCFLGAAPAQFEACCDCQDDCGDSSTCACRQLSVTAGSDPTRLYTHLRLQEPVPAGIYECGSWCGCERSRCQNRVVQRGLRVRLQVFRTRSKGWGVRCRDDLDKGTFVCTYAGIVLRMGRSLKEPLAPQKEDPVSDDEVEVVEEWTLPLGGREAVPEALDPSPPLHVPVIQRPADQPAVVLDGAKEQAEGQQEKMTSSPPDSSKTKNSNEEEEGVATKKSRLDPDRKDKKDQTTGKRPSTRGNAPKPSGPKQLYYLDATQEGNVGRFINHSCSSNLFVQNVFVDTHDPKFPAIAFFTSRPVRAGTELTWNYLYNPGSDTEHELQCHCGYKNCQGTII